MLISYAICTYNRERFLPIALDAIAQQTGNHFHLFELIVVDNNSTDSTPDIVHQFSEQHPYIQVVYTTETKQGLSYARNKAIEVARGEWIVFLDDDAYLDTTYTQHLVMFIQTKGHTYKAAGGPILLNFDTKPPGWYTHYLGSLLGYFKPYRQSREFSHNYYPRGSNMIFHRSLFERFGLFNPELGRKANQMLGSEEKDMFQRIYQAGERAYYDASLVMYHLVPEFRTTIDFIRKQSIGVGISEHIRIKSKCRAVLLKVLSECFKWVVSCLLCMFYMLQFKPRKGIILLRFRYWVFKGLTTKV